MSVEEVCNAQVLEEYAEALRALEPILYNLPAVIVAIDGRVGSGKTTLGRFLAWRFNVTLIESDLFLHRNEGTFTYRNDHITGILDSRMTSGSPVIVEGIVALRLLAEVCHKHAFHIHLIGDESVGSSTTEQEWRKYDAAYRPIATANLILKLPSLS
jgi:Ni2+-binding GTPase involved in maturation of urease and hydrogenase